MKQKIRHNLLVFLGFLVLLNLIFPPPGVPRKFSLNEGAIASFDVIAPYDFYISKTDQELLAERSEIAGRIPPIYELDNGVYILVSKKFSNLERAIDSLTRSKISQDSLILLIKRESALDARVIDYLLRNDYRQLLKRLNRSLTSLFVSGIVDFKPPEFKIITILSGDKEMVEFIDQLYSLAEAESIMTLNQSKEYRELLRYFLQANVIFNKEKTDQRIDEVFANVPKTKGKVLKGELIVEKHKRITAEALEKIVALERTFVSLGRWDIFRIIIFRNLLYLALIFLLYRFDKISKARLFERKNLYFIALLSALYLVIGKITYATDTLYLLPIAVFVFLFSLYFNLYIAIFFTVMFAAIFSVVLNSVAIFVYLSVSGLVAAFSIQTINSRLSLYRPSLYIAAANAGAIIFIDIYLLKGSFNILHIGEGILNSILATVVVALVLPLVEKLFDFATDLTLLELGNLNLPIFKDMSLAAAGSYHHSIIVGNLAEAGAGALGADPILARVGSYYHDIGKMKKSEYFIENQIGFKNPHDKLKPQMSALVIVSHVKEGIEMARKMKLPKKLIDIIEQHHGTTTIESFYRKALSASENINQDEFRYPGPKPKTKESALVMLADSIEATARSDKNITVAKLQKIVKENIEKRFHDGQLDDCPLTRSDLELIRTTFIPILTGIFHPRIEYDESDKKPQPPK